MCRRRSSRAGQKLGLELGCEARRLGDEGRLLVRVERRRRLRPGRHRLKWASATIRYRTGAPSARGHDQQGERHAVVVQVNAYEQTTAVGPQRLGDFAGRLAAADELMKLNVALRAVLDLE